MSSHIEPKRLAFDLSNDEGCRKSQFPENSSAQLRSGQIAERFAASGHRIGGNLARLVAVSIGPQPSSNPLTWPGDKNAKFNNERICRPVRPSLLAISAMHFPSANSLTQTRALAAAASNACRAR